MHDGPDLKLFNLVGWGRSFLSVAWPNGVQLVFSFAPDRRPGIFIVGQLTESVEPSFLIHLDVYHELSVCS